MSPIAVCDTCAAPTERRVPLAFRRGGGLAAVERPYCAACSVAAAESGDERARQMERWRAMGLEQSDVVVSRSYYDSPADAVAPVQVPAPFPWFGGKRRAASLVWERFGDVPNYVEPFAGSLAVLLGRPHAAHVETVNDKDAYLTNFWRALQQDPEGVAHWADWPVNECVTAGTLIATPEGNIPVEQVKVGMTVLGEVDGAFVSTVVRATKRSTTRELYTLGPLHLTANHPVWTAERGYIRADRLQEGDHITRLDWSVNKLDFVMLKCRHERADMADLCINRSSDERGSLRGSDVSRETSVQRAPISCRKRRADAQGLLDTIARCSRCETNLLNPGDRCGRRLAGRRATMACPLPSIGSADQSDGWGRWATGVSSDTRTAGEVVTDAARGVVCTGPTQRDVGQTSHGRGSRENPQGGNWSNRTTGDACQTLGSQERATTFPTCDRGQHCGSEGATAFSRASCKNCSDYEESETRSLCRDRGAISVNNGGVARDWSRRGKHLPSSCEGLPLGRISLASPVAVYNFETDTGNYFADSILVHNCDLHARHRWLLASGRERIERLTTDPDYYDVQVAGWWVWGLCAWIGSGWCRVRSLQLPNVGDGGRGIHALRSPAAVEPWRQRPNLDCAGKGVHRVPAKRPHLGNAGMGIARTSLTGLSDYFEDLAARLRRVRVCCGDWTRVMGPSVTVHNGLTGVFLDPPYASDRDGELYRVEDLSIAHAVRAWAIENGDNPLLRIALCGYEGDHDMPAGWACVAWKARGGYGSQGTGRGRANAGRERIWFSRHCLAPRAEQGALAL